MGGGVSASGFPGSGGHRRVARGSRLRERGERRGSSFSFCGNQPSSTLVPKHPHTPAKPRLSFSSDIEEDTLSDITVSAQGAGSGDLGSGSFAQAGATKKFKDDIEQERQQVPLSIEEDLFIYDDAIVSKNDSRTKHWCIEGRQPRHAVNSITQDDICTRLFRFTDFNVVVDEFDLAIEPKRASSVRRLSSLPSPSSNTLMGSRVTRTFPLNPNTVAALERRNREMAMSLIVARPLRNFEVRTLMGHADRVKCISIAPNEESFATCSCEGASVALRKLGDGEEFGILTGHRGTVIYTTFSPDGKLIATSSKDRTMILWDAAVAKLLYEFQHDRAVICCCFSPDSRVLVSGCQDCLCHVWDTRLARKMFTYSHHEGIVVSVAYSPDGMCCCSASADRTLRVWLAANGRTRFKMQGHRGIILSCSYTSSGAHIISNDEVFIFVWSSTDGNCRQRIVVSDIAKEPQQGVRGSRLGWTLSLAAPGAFTNYIVAACTNRFVYIIDFQTGSEVASTFCKAPVYSLACGTGNIVSFGDSFGNVYVQTLS